MSTLTGSYDFKTSKNTKDVAAADATSKANEAKKVATNFISSDSSGIMIYDGTGGAKTPSSPGTDTKNVFIDSDSVDIRKGSTVLATFGADGATIGVGTKSHSIVDANGMRLYASDGSTQIVNLGYGEGTAQSGTEVAPYYSLGLRGYPTLAIGNYSVAAGNLNAASGYASFAVGSDNRAKGECSYVEGSFNEALGSNSHAQGTGTIAQGSTQTVIGKNNIAQGSPNSIAGSDYAFIIGNGYIRTQARSNALTVDWDGNVDIASGAKYKINGTNLSASDVGALPLSGGTMTGQIKTSFKSSVATGSYGSVQSTVDDLVEEVRFSSGCMGSASISTAYTKGSVTIPTGWYNYIYSPHRSGGANGSASGDNCNYGNLLLMGMTVSGAYLIRVSSRSISEVKMLGSDYVRATFTPTVGNSYLNYGGCYYEKYGRVVHVHVGVMSLTTGTATNIYTLPSGFRPTTTVFAHGTGGAWNNIGYLEVDTSGAVTVRSQGTYCGADVTFMV